MIEFQIIVNVFSPEFGGRTTRHVVRSSDREAAIKKFQYLDTLLKTKNRFQENREWTVENLGVTHGQMTSIEGLYGVSYIKIAP
jgi:hypothetical protein